MNDLTIPSETQFPTSSRTAELAVELAKMLALVAPITMTAEQQEVWLRAAIDSLDGIWPREVAIVSQEVRGCVTRQSQIVPKIRELVDEHRKQQRASERLSREHQAFIEAPRFKPHIADRDRRYFTAADWDELNGWLASQGATKRYGPDGTRYEAAQFVNHQV